MKNQTSIVRTGRRCETFGLSWSKTLLVFGAALLAWCGGALEASGQLPLPKPATTAANEASGPATLGGDIQAPSAAAQGIETKLAEARANLAIAEARGDAALTNTPAGVSPHEVAMRRSLLQRLVRLFEQQLSNTAELETAKSRRADLVREPQNWTRLTESPPYSILLTDRLREEIHAEQLKLTSGEAAVSTLDRLAGEQRLALTQAEEKIRQLNEQLESAKDPAAAARLSWQRELERLRSQVAAAGLGVLDSEHQARQEALAESRVRRDWLQRQLIIADAGAKFTQADLDKVTSAVERESEQLERELAETQARWSKALQALEAARLEQRRTRARPNADPAATARISGRVRLGEAQVETAQAAIRMLRLMLESENIERTMWELRFAAYNSSRVETLRESARRLESLTRRLDLWKNYQQQQFDVSPSQIEIQEAHIANLAVDSELLPLAREHLDALRERDQLLLRLVRRIERVRRLSERWAEELHVAERELPFLSRVQDMFSDARTFLKKLWTFELFSAEDTITVDGQKISGKRSVTLGKIILAVLILGFGIWITGLISRITEPIIIRRLKIEPNQANLIRRWFRALLVVCLIMFSLMLVKIPLTVFAFAGGALAIGLGFGTQTLLKNFVSGLILLFERPFRVGDVLDVGGQRGTITEVGLRSSVLQLWDGTETLIPNSSLLENNVTNWTYSNRKVRFSVTLGVAYGSNTRRVIQLLAEVAERHGVVEKDPQPQVLFTDFGDNALIFELRYWVDVINSNAAQVGSDLRQMIAGAFAENGITIAFPQRDLHLDSARPFRVAIVPTLDSEPLAGKDKSGPTERKTTQDNRPTL